jgi:hypothetical protein
MLDTSRSRNQLALAFLVVGKLLGIVALVLGGAHRLLGGLFLGLDGLFILIAVGLCVSTMKAHAKEAHGQKEMLRQLMKEGTLDQYIRDLKKEEARAKQDDVADDGLERVQSAVG